MPKFKANAYLSTPKGVVPTGQTLELTKEQAERLGDKVTPLEEAAEYVQGQPLSEEEFRALPAEEQKAVVTDLNGDLNEYTNADKRWAFVSDNQ